MEIGVVIAWPMGVRSVAGRFYFSDVEPLERSLLGRAGYVHIVAVEARVESQELPSVIGAAQAEIAGLLPLIGLHHQAARIQRLEKRNGAREVFMVARNGEKRYALAGAFEHLPDHAYETLPGLETGPRIVDIAQVQDGVRLELERREKH